MQKFVFYISPFDPKSGGVRGMYFLSESVARMGFEVALNEPCGPEDIAVIPDQHGNNTFGARKVVRYFCYYPSHWYGGHRIPKEELAITYDRQWADEVQSLYDGCLGPPLAFPLIEPGLFFPKKKDIPNLLYLPDHKRGFGGASGIDQPVVVTRVSHSREEAADLLRRTIHFHTPDSYTAMLPEALLCGCSAWIVRGENEFEPYTGPSPARMLMTEENGLAAATELTTRAMEFFKCQPGSCDW